MSGPIPLPPEIIDCVFSWVGSDRDLGILRQCSRTFDSLARRYQTPRPPRLWRITLFWDHFPLPHIEFEEEEVAWVTPHVNKDCGYMEIWAAAPPYAKYLALEFDTAEGDPDWYAFDEFDETTRNTLYASLWNASTGLKARIMRGCLLHTDSHYTDSSIVVVFSLGDDPGLVWNNFTGYGENVYTEVDPPKWLNKSFSFEETELDKRYWEGDGRANVDIWKTFCVADG